MSLLSKDQLKQLIQDNNIRSVDDVQNTLKDLFAETLQEMLEAELDTHLGYLKHDSKGKDTSNSRNGHSKKTLSSEYGDVRISIPRDRQSNFEPAIVKKHQTNTNGIEEQIIALYARGVSTRDIQSHLGELYGLDVSPTLISNVTDKILPLIADWHNRPLEPVYAVLFLDAIHFKVKQDGHIVNKAAYVIVGIDLEGHKDVLGIWIGESESAKFWLAVLSELQNRGVQDILIACVDNLKGFSEAIQAGYPKTEIQKCIVHQMRNSLKYVAAKDYKAISAALKPIYKASTEEAAFEELNSFEETWGQKYPLIVRSWRANWDELTAFFKYPPQMRRIIYTTNVIESYHRQLRKVTKGKGAFPTDNALMKILYLATMEVRKKWTMRIHDWGQILSHLSIYFGDRVTPYID